MAKPVFVAYLPHIQSSEPDAEAMEKEILVNESLVIAELERKLSDEYHVITVFGDFKIATFMCVNDCKGRSDVDISVLIKSLKTDTQNG